jgi:hypothetical protein
MGHPVDPRIAAVGGTRKRAKAEYDYRGMVPWTDWRKTRVHEHTSAYACFHCGQTFATPHAVYTHLAKRHGK